MVAKAPSEDAMAAVAPYFEAEARFGNGCGAVELVLLCSVLAGGTQGTAC